MAFHQWMVVVLLTAASILAFVTVTAPPVAATDLCGMSIWSDVKLNQDLSCAGDGLIIAADDVTIKLNGHSITGSGTDATSAGIRIVARSEVSILGPGTITMFRTGVLIKDSSDIVVKRVHAVDNGLMTPGGPPFPFSASDGVHVTMSSDVRLERNLARHNGDDGINLHLSSDVRVVGNTVDDNIHDGIRLDLADGNEIANNHILSHDSVFPIGSPPVNTPVGCGIELFGSKDNEIEENRLVANTNGIRLRNDASNTIPSTGNELEENRVDGTGAELGGRRGIHLTGALITGNEIEENKIMNHAFGIRLDLAPVGNTFEENKIRMNTCGVGGSTAGNVFEDNKLRDNGTDFCP